MNQEIACLFCQPIKTRCQSQYTTIISGKQLGGFYLGDRFVEPVKSHEQPQMSTHQQVRTQVCAWVDFTAVLKCAAAPAFSAVPAPVRLLAAFTIFGENLAFTHILSCMASP